MDKFYARGIQGDGRPRPPVCPVSLFCSSLTIITSRYNLCYPPDKLVCGGSTITVAFKSVPWGIVPAMTPAS